VQKLRDVLGQGALWAAVAIGLALPVSTALDNVLLFLVLLTGILSGIFWRHWTSIWRNPVALAALLLCGLLVLGSFYGQGAGRDAVTVLGKYADILFIALLLPLFKESRYRRYGLALFSAVMVLTLVLSYLIWFGAFEGTQFFADRTRDNPVVFKLHITHGILMAFAAYLFAVKARSGMGLMRILMMALGVLAAFNVLFMVQGRTGYLVLGVLGVFYISSLLGRRSLWFGVAGAVAVSIAGYLVSPTLKGRVDIALHEAQVWQPGQGSNEGSSIGTRMDYYTNTLKIIVQHPFIGVGTGGFEKVYRQQIAGTAVAPSNNPHNQFLLIAAQLGLPGLAAFMFLLMAQWRTARNLPAEEERLLARGVVLTMLVGSLFNSMLLDHTEGLFYAWFSGLLFAGYRISSAGKG
jgi:O-antigen ligase